MHAKKLPTILELMEADSAGAVKPNHECRMGWCTQCACNKQDIEKAFGAVTYRSEPSIPPVQGKVLTCISTQAKSGEDLEKLKLLFDYQFNVQVMKKGTVLARLPLKEEIGSAHKTLVVANQKIVVGQRATIQEDSVIVRNPREISPGKNTDILVTKAQFVKTYGSLPETTTFKAFSEAKPVNGFRITEEIAHKWSKDSGRMYFKNGRETHEVFIGTVITENGKAVTEEMAKRLEIRDVHSQTLGLANNRNSESMKINL